MAHFDRKFSWKALEQSHNICSKVVQGHQTVVNHKQIYIFTFCDLKVHIYLALFTKIGHEIDTFLFFFEKKSSSTTF